MFDEGNEFIFLDVQSDVVECFEYFFWRIEIYVYLFDGQVVLYEYVFLIDLVFDFICMENLFNGWWYCCFRKMFFVMLV